MIDIIQPENCNIDNCNNNEFLFEPLALSLFHFVTRRMVCPYT